MNKGFFVLTGEIQSIPESIDANARISNATSTYQLSGREGIRAEITVIREIYSYSKDNDYRVNVH